MRSLSAGLGHSGLLMRASEDEENESKNIGLI
jgi:hypothetical protein